MLTEAVEVLTVSELNGQKGLEKRQKKQASAQKVCQTIRIHLCGIQSRHDLGCALWAVESVGGAVF